MPWRCPVCATQIRHSPVEERPRPKHLYRCHICRLELVIDESTNKLTVAPFDDRHQPAGKPPSKPAAEVLTF